ncbi:MAG TPA: hypothetical protein VFN45_14360 [Myxococcaceae bacterium]|nr:hypothetical protein [Myxococcaceae bacterium]
MRDIVRRALTVAGLSAGAIVLHELGHRAVFLLTGTPARMGFQRVDPTVPVSHSLWLWGKAGGPVVTLVLAAVLLAIARRHVSFGWATAAFTNASLRLFPLTMDLGRAFRGAPPSSDEGELVSALTSSIAGRVSGLIAVWLVFGVLSVLAARTFPFPRRRWLGVAAVYLGSLAVGIGAAIADELLEIRGS